MLRFTFSTGLVIAGVLAACGDGDEPSASTSVTKEPTSAPSPRLAPVPEEWPTYRDASGLFSIRYPVEWVEIDGDLFSYDPRVVDFPGYGLAPEAIKVEIAFNPVAQSNICGSQSVDRTTGEVLSTLPEATAVTLGGQPAWQFVRTSDESDLQGNTRIQVISLIYDHRCVSIYGYFTQQEPDVTTFLQMASTFQFES
jgi:hypothetical protein